MAECSEQGAGWLLLLALCWPVGLAVTEHLPDVLATEPAQHCQRWYKPDGRDYEGRQQFIYKMGCWRAD